MKELILSVREIKALAAAVEEEPASVLRYIGKKPLRDDEGNLVMVASDRKNERIVLTPFDLRTGDGRRVVPLSDPTRRALQKFFSR